MLAGLSGRNAQERRGEKLSNHQHKNTLNVGSPRQRQKPPENIRWYEDGMHFETMREADEWADTVVYNEIGGSYDGYKTTDQKVAAALVFLLVRSISLYGKSFRIDADIEWSNPPIYRVWVSGRFDRT